MDYVFVIGLIVFYGAMMFGLLYYYWRRQDVVDPTYEQQLEAEQLLAEIQAYLEKER